MNNQFLKFPGLCAMLLTLAACGGGDDVPSALNMNGSMPGQFETESCVPGAEPVMITGHADTDQAKTYLLLPFDVAAGTTRVEVGYSWADSSPLPSTPITQSVFDLGLWDEAGYSNAAGFRGWSGSRQGRLHDDQPPIFVQSDSAERGYVPGTVNAGVWHVELGIAALGPAGADWTVQIECLSPAVGAEPAADPVDATHVANDQPGWYHADFHMHGYHSNNNAPASADFVQQARDGNLDVLVVTEYVTGRHWDELGAVQRAHPDLLIWPGREIITYFGHANTFGETPNVIDYRHGFEDVTLAEIQAETKAAGALFQVNHPTTFEGPLFQNFCRGCAFELSDQIDWSQVDTLEVMNGPVLVNQTELGLPGLPLPLPLAIQNPFLQPAIDLWHDLLNQGFKITATSGSDSKGVDAPEERTRKGYGSSATAIYADNLSRAAITEAIQAGRAYIKTRGVAASPSLEMNVATTDGQTGTFGSVLQADSATLTVTVTDGDGQVLRVIQNGQPVNLMPINGSPFEFTMDITRASEEGPLGTFWRVETLDVQSITTIGNPVFLQ